MFYFAKFHSKWKEPVWLAHVSNSLWLLQWVLDHKKEHLSKLKEEIRFLICIIANASFYYACKWCSANLTCLFSMSSFFTLWFTILSVLAYCIKCTIPSAPYANCSIRLPELRLRPCTLSVIFICTFYPWKTSSSLDKTFLYLWKRWMQPFYHF